MSQQPNPIESDATHLVFEHTAVNNDLHLFIRGVHDPKLCPECIQPGSTAPTAEGADHIVVGNEMVKTELPEKRAQVNTSYTRTEHVELPDLDKPPKKPRNRRDDQRYGMSQAT